MSIPIVHVICGTREGSVTSLVFNFGTADKLREETMSKLKKIVKASPHIVGQSGLVLVALGTPCESVRAHQLLQTLADTCNFDLKMGNPVDEDGLKDIILGQLD